MSDDLRSQIYLNFSQRQTEELLEIWRTHDSHEWSEMTFYVIREILQERNVELPPQDEPLPEAHDAEGVAPLRPMTVSYAVYLALAGLAVRAVLIAVGIFTGQFGATAHPPFALFVGLMVAGFVVFESWLIYGAWLGRNRRRILYIVWIVSASVLNLANGAWAQDWAVQPVRTAVSILATGIELVAVVLLLLPISNAWYREMGQRNQVAKAKRPQRPTRRSSSDKWLPSQVGWIPLALSFALVLILNAAILVRVNETNPNGWVKGAYVGPCLPVSAVILAICAWFGARVAKKDGGNPWQGATIGVWIGAIPAIALSLWALLGIGGGQ